MKLDLIQKKKKNGDFTSKIKGTNIFHCEDGPAIIYGNTVQYEFLGLRHRLDGPALTEGKKPYIRSYWYLMGLPHRVGGPWMQYDYEGSHEKTQVSHDYAIFGRKYTKSAYAKLMKNKAFVAKVKELESQLGSLYQKAETISTLSTANNPQADPRTASGIEHESLFSALAMIGIAGMGAATAAGFVKKKSVIAKNKAERSTFKR